MSGHQIPAREQNCACFLLDAGRTNCRMVPGCGNHLPVQERRNCRPAYVDLGHGKRGTEAQEEFRRSIQEGRLIAEGWQLRKDGARFWASMIAVAMHDKNGDLQGFAVVVRDFSDRRQRHEQLRRGEAAGRPAPFESAIVGVVSGEFDRIPEANDAFLELVGHSRAELLAGRIEWSNLTPKKYEALDELAHEEALRFGASAPVRKELIRKDGTTVPVLVTTAILSLMPFRWVGLVTDLRERERLESTAEEDGDALTPRGGNCRCQRGAEGRNAANRSGRTDRRDRVDPGRNRHRKRTGRARYPPNERAQRSSFCHAELCGDSDWSAGERTLRLRKGSVHRRFVSKNRPL